MPLVVVVVVGATSSQSPEPWAVSLWHKGALKDQQKEIPLVGILYVQAGSLWH